MICDKCGQAHGDRVPRACLLNGAGKCSTMGHTCELNQRYMDDQEAARGRLAERCEALRQDGEKLEEVNALLYDRLETQCRTAKQDNEKLKRDLAEARARNVLKLAYVDGVKDSEGLYGPRIATLEAENKILHEYPRARDADRIATLVGALRDAHRYCPCGQRDAVCSREPFNALAPWCDCCEKAHEQCVKPEPKAVGGECVHTVHRTPEGECFKCGTQPVEECGCGVTGCTGDDRAQPEPKGRGGDAGHADLECPHYGTTAAGYSVDVGGHIIGLCSDCQRDLEAEVGNVQCDRSCEPEPKGAGGERSEGSAPPWRGCTCETYATLQAKVERLLEWGRAQDRQRRQAEAEVERLDVEVAKLTAEKKFLSSSVAMHSRVVMANKRTEKAEAERDSLQANVLAWQGKADKDEATNARLTAERVTVEEAQTQMNRERQMYQATIGRLRGALADYIDRAVKQDGDCAYCEIVGGKHQDCCLYVRALAADAGGG